MRNPNGFGGVIKLSGKRRKPYCARVTDGWTITGDKKKQNFKPIGYFAKRQEALDALFVYHENPQESLLTLRLSVCYVGMDLHHT